MHRLDLTLRRQMMVGSDQRSLDDAPFAIVMCPHLGRLGGGIAVRFAAAVGRSHPDLGRLRIGPLPSWY